MMQERMAGESVPSFRAVPAAAVRSVLERDLARCEAVVAEAYRLHRSGGCVLPGSLFVHPDEGCTNRIIAMPCAVRDGRGLAGLKWIASFPGNHSRSLPRASAVVILNDPETGFPVACLEGSLISAARTAASASLCARLLRPERSAQALAIVGAGLIARSVYRFLKASAWSFGEVRVFDPDRLRADAFVAQGLGSEHASVALSLDAALRDSDLVLFATTAMRPHVFGPDALRRGALVLHLSLRDLAPEVIASALNVTDSADHAFTAGTSLELAERACGHRRFLRAQIFDLLEGDSLPVAQTTIVSPFGLAILDLALSTYVFEEARTLGLAVPIASFFGEERTCEPMEAVR